MSILLPSTVVLGIIIGATIMPASILPMLQPLIMIFLYLLLCCIGINLTAEANIFKLIKEIHPLALILIPLSACGSIAGAAFITGFGGDSPWLGAAIGAGFGWYSLAGVLLSESLGPASGALAFLTNTFRELLALAFLPLAIKHLGQAGFVLGGATTMDTTLAIISKAGGSEMTCIALLHGIMLSTLVPILVPILATFVP